MTISSNLTMGSSVTWTALFAALMVVASVDAQSASWGSCPDVTTQKELDINRYLGTWYQIKAVPNFFQSVKDGNCGSANYSLKADGHINVVNTEYIDGKAHVAIGDAYRPDDSEQGKLKVRFFSLAPYGKYWVIDTDYTHYTVVYSCTDIVVGKLTYGWIMSRERTLDNSTLTKLEGELTSMGVDISPFITTKQIDCSD